MTWAKADFASLACPAQSSIFCRQLRCSRSLFSKHCIRSRIIFHNVSSWYDADIVLLENFGTNSEFKWHRSMSVAKCTVLPSFCASSMTSFAFDFRLSPFWQVLQIFPLFVDCGVSVWNLHCMEYGNRCLHKIVLTQRIEPRLSNVILMIFVLSLFSALSDGFVGFNSACVYCSSFL